MKTFYSLVQNKCPHCKNVAKNVKKEGANKIFVVTTHKEEQTNQRKKSRDSASKGESAHHTNDVTEDIKHDKKRRQKFYTQK